MEKTEATARQINRMLADAEARGRNLYLQYNASGREVLRVVRAETRAGVLSVRTPSGDWFPVKPGYSFDAR